MGMVLGSNRMKLILVVSTCCSGSLAEPGSLGGCRVSGLHMLECRTLLQAGPGLIIQV